MADKWNRPEQSAAPGQAVGTQTPADMMRSAMQQRRGSEEEFLWQGAYSPKAMYGAWLGAGVLTLVILAAMLLVPALRASGWAWLAALSLVVLLWLAPMLLVLWRRLTHHYELTTQRLRHREGIFVRRWDRIELIHVDDVTYRQGLVQTMLGVGDLTILSSDQSHPKLTLYGIDEVRRVADLVDDARRAERLRRGIHIESI